MSATDGGSQYGSGGGLSQDDAGIDYPLASPIFVKNRYGREDLLALLTKDVRPPDGLDNCQFFVPNMQKPVTLLTFTELETVGFSFLFPMSSCFFQRLQHNINSSKAMSSIAHAERVTAVVGSSGTAPTGGGTSTTAGGVMSSTSAVGSGGNMAVVGGAPFAPGWMDRGGTAPMMNKTDRGGYLGTGRGGFSQFRGVGRPGIGGSSTNTSSSSAAVLATDTGSRYGIYLFD